MTNTPYSKDSLIAQLNGDVGQTNTSGLSDEQQALLLSELLLQEEITIDEIEIIERIATKSKNPALWVNLGQLYQSVGSNDLAEKTFTQAIKLAQAAQEPVELILAQAGLANILNLQAKKKDSESLLEEVKRAVNALEAEDQHQTRSNCNPNCTQVNHNCGACCRDGMQGKCVLIDGTNWILCRTLICPQ